MSSRNEILARVRRQSVPDSPLPDLQGNWITYADKRAQFTDVVTSVGGKVVLCPARESLVELIRGLPCWPAEGQPIVSTVADAPVGNRSLDAVDDPHALADVELAVLTGEFAVAENGAVWVTDQRVRQRAIYFLTQHLVLVVPRDEIVDHMGQAYERVRFDGPGYGLFISGPSKTADIEQSLVIGAHGPRSLTVVLL